VSCAIEENPLRTLDQFQPRAVESAALHRRQVALLTDALRRSWWWQTARKRAICERRACRLRELLDCYDLPAGACVEVPSEWIR